LQVNSPSNHAERRGEERSGERRESSALAYSKKGTNHSKGCHQHKGEASKPLAPHRPCITAIGITQKKRGFG
jgi:hypothetical protein